MMQTQAEIFEYAGFWVRVAATLIDTLLIMLITLPLLWSIYGADYFESTAILNRSADFIISWLMPAVGVIVFWMVKQATPGKMALSLRVLDADTGNSLSAGQSVGRYLAYFVSMLPLFIGIIWVAFDKKKQGWHDKLAGTVVVRAKNRAPEKVQFPSAL
ncbi:MAG: RDD family protein [Sideroxydans sp.]